MAESSENKNGLDKEINNDLDSMLDETAESLNQEDGLIDDEDAIDKLLMDNAFDENTDEPDEFAEIDQLINDEPADESNGSDIVDEFSDDDVDEFADSSDDNVGVSQSEEEVVEEYDISADEEEAIAEPEDELVVEQTSEDKTEPEVSAPADAPQTAEIDMALAALMTEIAELQNGQNVLKQQITSLEQQSNDSSVSDTVSEIQSEQKNHKRKLNALEAKKPVIAFAALGVAILALLVGGGLGLVGFFANSKVEDLSETVLSIEEQVDFLVEKDSSKKLEELTQKIEQIEAGNSATNEQIEQLNKIIADLPSAETIKTLQEKIDQLGEQNLQMGETIEVLQSQLDAVQARKKIKPRRVKKKVARPAQKWQINLVSYRQQWYAKRKANEFSQQGIPAEVIKIRKNGQNWYRLTVRGLKSQAEANALADKIKKKLNLPSVWVNKE